jgi:hypothetical protein
MTCPFCGHPFSSDFRGANWAFVHSKVMLHLMSECRSSPRPCDEPTLRARADDIADALTQQISHPLEERSADPGSITSRERH